MTKRMIHFGLSFLSAIAMSMGVLSATTVIKNRTVSKIDCSRSGQSITAALENQTSDTPVILHVFGVCHERVLITRNDVILMGDPKNPDSAVIDAGGQGAPISIDGGRNILVAGVTLRAGGSSGLSAVNGASVTLRNSVLSENREEGVLLDFSSSAVIDDNTIENNGLDGIRVAFNSVARMSGNRIEGNGRDGVQIAEGSFAEIGRRLPESIGNHITMNQANGVNILSGSGAALIGNRIELNNQDGGDGGVAVSQSNVTLKGENTIGENRYGIYLNQGSLRLSGDVGAEDRITQNGYSGIIAINGSSLEISQGLVDGNGTLQGDDDDGISVTDNSYLRLQGATVQGNEGSAVVLSRGAGLLFGVPAAHLSAGVDEFGLGCRGADGGATHYGVSFDDALPLGTIIENSCIQILP